METVRLVWPLSSRRSVGGRASYANGIGSRAVHVNKSSLRFIPVGNESVAAKQFESAVDLENNNPDELEAKNQGEQTAPEEVDGEEVEGRRENKKRRQELPDVRGKRPRTLFSGTNLKVVNDG